MKAALKRVLAGVPLLLPFIGFFFIVSGIIGLLYIQQPLSESQDPRSQASIEDGSTQITSLTTTTADLKTLNQETTISLGYNTNNTPINQLTVVFNIVTNTTNTLELQLPEMSGITAATELETTEDGFLAEVVLEPEDGSFFISNFYQPFIELNFTPEETGDVELNFDTEQSVALHADTGTDTLSHVPTFNYSITQPEDDSQTFKSCNEQCSSNAECQSGYRCYQVGDQSRCRLAINPSSSSCQAEDDSEKSQCNQSCEANRDCTSGLSCYQNQCRNPDNLSSSSCAEPQTTSGQTSDQSVQGCNQSCNSNADCEINLRCYQDSCRLATNPSSTSCSASTEKTVSKRYTKGEPRDDELATAAADSATDSATATTAASPSPATTPTPTPDSADDQASEPETLAEEQFSLPISTIAVGTGLLILGIAAILLIRAFKNRGGPPPAKPPSQTSSTTSSPPPSKSSSSQNSNMVNRLKQKGVAPPKSENSQ